MERECKNLEFGRDLNKAKIVDSKSEQGFLSEIIIIVNIKVIEI
jgi:hypothetical protein